MSSIPYKSANLFSALKHGILLSCALVGITSQSKTILVSDIDDTIKATGIHQAYSIIGNALATINQFDNMNLLYSTWYDQKQVDDQIIYLTAAPNPIYNLGLQFLEAEGSKFPPKTGTIEKNLIGKALLDTDSAGDFKYKALVKLYESSKQKPDQMILIGDNGEQDIPAYSRFAAYLEESRAATKVSTFIHLVYESKDNSTPLAAGQFGFLTSSDLAIRLYHKGLLPKSDTSKENIAKIIHDGAYNSVAGREFDLNATVIPSFMECHYFNSWPRLDDDLSDIATSSNYTLLQSNVKALCENQ